MDLIYLDCFSGISGDMLLAALISLGFPFSALEDLISSLQLGISLKSDELQVQGISARGFRVHDSLSTFRNLTAIEHVFHTAALPSPLASDALRVIRRIAEAEASIHGISVDAVHFHELGAADTIVDVLGTLYAIEYLGIKKVYCAPLPWPKGFIPMDHGHYPNPAPATALLLQGIPCQGVEVDMELVTPTGAALVGALNPVFGPLPLCKPVKIGYGAGSKTRPDLVPNLLRIVGADYLDSAGLDTQSIAVLECEIDDMNPEWVPFLSELLLPNPVVLDVFTAPILMKKGRSGILLTVLCQPQGVLNISSLILQHSSTLGLRYTIQNRVVIQRREERLDTPWGPVRIKVALLPQGPQRFKPEFEDCQAIALAHGLPLHHIYQEIATLAGKRFSST